MIKEFLIDADGVVIKKHEYFSSRLAKKQGLDLETVMPFFRNEFGSCCTGKADLKEVLPKYFSDWKWTGTVDELLEFWFPQEAEIDADVLAKIDDLRHAGKRVSLASDNEKYRARYLVNVVRLGEHFDELFFSSDFGYKKSQPEWFQTALEKLNVKPDEVAYWDDDPKNVDIARGLGITAFVFNNFKEFEQQTASLL